MNMSDRYPEKGMERCPLLNVLHAYMVKSVPSLSHDKHTRKSQAHDSISQVIGILPFTPTACQPCTSTVPFSRTIYSPPFCSLSPQPINSKPFVRKRAMPCIEKQKRVSQPTTMVSRSERRRASRPSACVPVSVPGEKTVCIRRGGAYEACTRSESVHARLVAEVSTRKKAK